VYGVVIYNLCVYGYTFFRGNHVLRWLEKLGDMSLWIFLVHYPLVIWSISLTSLLMTQTSLVFLLSGLLSLTLSVSLGLLFRELYSRILSLVQMKKGNGVIFENHYPMGQV
jgi:peptidoglycan/LPS O-acetylase OafA/YrhL